MKNIGLNIRIGAKIGSAVSELQKLGSSTTSLGAKVQALSQKRIDIITNDKSVLKIKKSLENVDIRLDYLRNKKTALSLQLDKNKVYELNSQINKIDDKIDKLRNKEEIIELKIKATTNEKELKKLNKSLDTTRKNILNLSSEKLDIKEKLSDVKKANEKVNQELKKTSSEISEINSQKLNLKNELKEAEFQAEKTNKKVLSITKSINRINAAKINIKSTIHKTEIIKQNFIGNVGKVVAMSAALGGVAFGINKINEETTQMANLAGTVGLSFGTVNTLGSAIKGIGLNYEHVTDIMEELNNKIGESKVKYKEWLKEDKGKGKELKLVGGVDDAFKGLDFSLSDKSFRGLNYEKTFKKFIKMKGDKQFELVMDTALKMKDKQKAASMVDILMGGEANKILSFLRKQGLSYKEFITQQEKMNYLNKEGLKGAKDYAKVSAKTSNILGSMFKQIAGIGGSFLTPILKKFNRWLVINKEMVQLNIKGFFDGIKEALGSIGKIIKWVSSFLKPLISLFSSTSDEAEKAGASGASLGKTLTYIAGGFTALMSAKLIMGGLGMAVGVVTTAFRVLSVVVSLNPIGLAITAIGIAIYGLYNASDKFKAKLKALFSWSPLGLVIRTFTPVVNFVRNLWNGMSFHDAGKRLIMSLFDGIKSTWNKLKGIGSSIKKSISGWFDWGDDTTKPKTIKVAHHAKVATAGLALGGGIAFATPDIPQTLPIIHQNREFISPSSSTNTQNINLNFGDTHIISPMDEAEFHQKVFSTVQNALNEDKQHKNDIRMHD